MDPKSVHWSALPDFGSPFGDIKTVWEASRFAWAPVLACAHRLAPSRGFGALVNAWVADWSEKNPPNVGWNWKCGQETSIRLLHLLLAGHLLGELENPQPALVDFVSTHARRIGSTMQYAVAQDNNHGISEAAALYIAGAWLANVSDDAEVKKLAARSFRVGRYRLSERVNRLVLPDGTFSQYSTNYHRLLLDVLSLAELFRRLLKLPPFPETMLSKIRSAIEWLTGLIDPDNGDVPNLGHNDGARLLPLCCTYRDFRPAAELASALFNSKTSYPPGPWTSALRWLAVEAPYVPPAPQRSRAFPKGGFVVLRTQQQNARVLFRLPRFQFRPAHADALHVDLWLGPHNILRDGGTFSYADRDIMPPLTEGAGHNLIEFDGRSQMPRVGRFLFGRWLEGTAELEHIRENRIAAQYRDFNGAEHRRDLHLENGRLTVRDYINGLFHYAILRWRLEPGEWHLHETDCDRDGVNINISGAKDLRLTEGIESTHYLEARKIPVLVAQVTRDEPVITTISWVT
jgi:hypothetical protein